ncbi:hypothetical protein [Rhodoglobus sp.]
MAKFTLYLHRIGAFAANVAQTFLQTYGGGNGDPQAFDETAARKRGSESAAAPESGDGTDAGSGVHRKI